MPGSNAEGRPGPQLNPQALRLEDLVRLLSALGGRGITEDVVQADIDDGAPTNADGTINLVNYAVWLVAEMGRGN